jgi:ankyrin repeat protein
MLEVILTSSMLEGSPMPKIKNKGSQTVKRYITTMTALLMMLGGIFLPLSLSATITDLHYAAASGDVAEITRLLDAGADIEARADGAFTPLHWAAFGGQPATITTLLDRGADAKARSDDGQRPIDIANEKNMPRDTAYWRLHDASY